MNGIKTEKFSTKMIAKQIPKKNGNSGNRNSTSSHERKPLKCFEQNYKTKTNKSNLCLHKNNVFISAWPYLLQGMLICMLM